MLKFEFYKKKKSVYLHKLVVNLTKKQQQKQKDRTQSGTNIDKISYFIIFFLNNNRKITNNYIKRHRI